MFSHRFLSGPTNPAKLQAKLMIRLTQTQTLSPMQATSTLILFSFKTNHFCYTVHSSLASTTEVVLLSRQEETETFANNGADITCLTS